MTEDISTLPPRPAALDALDAATNGSKPDTGLYKRPAILDHMSPSGLRMHYIVEMDDGRFYEARTTAADVLFYERTYKKGWFDESGQSFQRLLFVAWAALKRTGAPEVDKFPDFEAHVVDVNIEEPGAEVDPTLVTPSED